MDLGYRNDQLENGRRSPTPPFLGYGSERTMWWRLFRGIPRTTRHDWVLSWCGRAALLNEGRHVFLHEGTRFGDYPVYTFRPPGGCNGWPPKHVLRDIHSWYICEGDDPETARRLCKATHIGADQNLPPSGKAWVWCQGQYSQEGSLASQYDFSAHPFFLEDLDIRNSLDEELPNLRTLTKFEKYFRSPFYLLRLNTWKRNNSRGY
jgi:hypothetical protein